MLNVFNIQRYSIHDGEGIRTNIFFKGCPLRCQWCNNPESFESSPSIMFDARLCRRFGDCLKAGGGSVKITDGRLFIDRDNIKDPALLRNVCPSKAIEVMGKEMTCSEIIAEIEKDLPFYIKSGGGVTISGGEPFIQGPELLDLLSGLKQKGIHVAAETSLHVPWSNIEHLLDYVDVFLTDLKHTSHAKFSEFTGGDLSMILSNFMNLDRSGKTFVIRIPVIPGFNYTEQEIFSIIEFASQLKNSNELNFIPFHSLAQEKYEMLGMKYSFSGIKNVDKSELRSFVSYAEKKGFIAKILN